MTGRRMRILATLAVLACAACGDSSPPVPGVAPPSSVASTVQEAALRSFVLDGAVASHQRLVAAAERLADDADSSCADPAVLRADWRAARLAWDAASAYPLGAQQRLHLVAAVDWWPVDAAAVLARAEGGRPVTPAELEAMGAATRGLPAIEVLLYEARAPLTAAACTYLAEAARSIATKAAAVADALAQDVDVLVRGDAAVTDLLSTLADATYRVCDEQLGMPSGNAISATGPDLGLLHGRDGRMAGDDVRATLVEIGRAYELGFQPIVAARYAEATDPIAAALQTALQGLDAVGPDLRAAIERQEPGIAGATDTCRNVRRTFSTSVAGLLAVTLTIPVGDGD